MSIKSIKVISRNPDDYMRDTVNDIHKVQRNFDAQQHPFQEAREYVCALNAAKLERVFAKPFITSLSHSEIVSCMARHPSKPSCIFSGTVEGELRQWNLKSHQCELKVQAHIGEIYAISAFPEGDSFFSVGADKTIKRWSVDNTLMDNNIPRDTWLSESMVVGISHNTATNDFVTCGDSVLLWDIKSKSPKSCYDWSINRYGNECSVHFVKFDPVDKNIFAAADHANNLILYDTRDKEVRKFKMKFRINSFDWNPMESYILTAASEDYSCYTFDIRKLDEKSRIVKIHKGHTSAVIDINYSPTGKEFCTGGYDRSMRIFNKDSVTSRDIYHTKRMFRIKCVLWSGDATYILSGSTDHNIRLWKADASQKLGPMNRREKESINYSNELKRKYKDMPQVSRILRHRHLPKPIYHAREEHKAIAKSQMKKTDNLRKHSRRGAVPYVSATDKVVADSQELQISLEEHLIKEAQSKFKHK